jgi:tRNA (adenine57-N1/adenine58-N1)-methyltransferase
LAVDSAVLAEGDRIVLHDKSGRRYRVLLAAGAKLSLHSGALPHDDLIGRPEGTVVVTHQGSKLVALRPTFAETVIDRKRTAQPIYPKDLGAILVGADIQPGSTVLEAGSGTGSLTIALLRAVGPQGRVVSYEIREDFVEAARKAVVEFFGAEPAWLTLQQGDLYGGVRERGMDRACLDLPEPWQAIGTLKESVRAGGIVFAHCPNVSQVQKFADGLREAGGFGLIETVEVLQRGWTIRGRSMRPAHRMVAHTGFLTFARRLAGDEVFEAEGEGF